VRLETEIHGRRLAVRVLRKLARDGAEKCRASPARHAMQAGALRVALYKLLQGSREARDGFAAVLTDALGARLLMPGELVELYQGMQAAGRFRQRPQQ
jgi:hypothetical protein